MQTSRKLAWQSQVIVFLVLAGSGAYVAYRLAYLTSLEPLLWGIATGVILAAAVYLLRSATVGAALLGGFLILSYSLIPGGPHSPVFVLLATLALTLGASRIGREKKGARESSEEKQGRVASQVAANLGVGALAGFYGGVNGASAVQMLLVAALAEATADTLASEIGQLATAPPRMLLTGAEAVPGTDGAISVLGTAAGIVGAFAICCVGQWAFAFSLNAMLAAWVAAIIGVFVDSALGQTFERRGLLNNDAVNFSSTLSASIAVWIFSNFLP